MHSSIMFPFVAVLAAGGVSGALASERAADRDDTKIQAPSSQVEHGAQVFAEHCAKCHGAQAQGGPKAPALVGKKVLTKFMTAQDVYDFASVKMPKDAPGSLKPDEYWAVIAFALTGNGIDFGGTLGPKNAKNIKLHGQ
jgi:mono/diheme cytochrome c family protein